MFRLLKWGFQGLILVVLIAALQRGYRALADTGIAGLPRDPLVRILSSTASDEVRFRGMDRVTLAPQSLVPGTDILFVGIENDEAVFIVAGETSRRRVGDSLIYRDPWNQVNETFLDLSSRIIRLTASEVHLLQFYTLTVRDTAPVPGPVSVSPGTPYTLMLQTQRDSVIPGTTLTFRGRGADGAAQIEGQPGSDYDRFKVMDSVRWSGQLRDDLWVRYNFRVVFFTESYIFLGGTVDLSHHS